MSGAPSLDQGGQEYQRKTDGNLALFAAEALDNPRGRGRLGRESHIVSSNDSGVIWSSGQSGSCELAYGDSAPPIGYGTILESMDLHKLAAERSLAFHQVIANQLIQDRAVLERARERVKTWLAQTPARPFARDWERVLGGDAESIAAFLADRSELAEELRQSSPFAGALDARERWRIWRDTRQKLVGER